MAKAIIVTGTPGVGKSRLAKALAKRLGVQLVELGLFVRKERLYSGRDVERGSYILDEERLGRRLRGMLAGGRDLVISTHYLGRLFPRRAVRLVLVLRLDPVILYRRLRDRGWTRKKAWENVESELIDICLFDAEKSVGEGKVFEINTTSKWAGQVLREAMGIIEGKRSGGHRVNWLRTYDPLALGRRLLWTSVS